jgi:hypothetical protein
MCLLYTLYHLYHLYHLKHMCLLYTLYTLYHLYTIYIPSIYHLYTIYIPSIYHLYTIGPSWWRRRRWCRGSSCGWPSHPTNCGTTTKLPQNPVPNHVFLTSFPTIYVSFNTVCVCRYDGLESAAQVGVICHRSYVIWCICTYNNRHIYTVYTH